MLFRAVARRALSTRTRGAGKTRNAPPAHRQAAGAKTWLKLGVSPAFAAAARDAVGRRRMRRPTAVQRAAIPAHAHKPSSLNGLVQ